MKRTLSMLFYDVLLSPNYITYRPASAAFQEELTKLESTNAEEIKTLLSILSDILTKISEKETRHIPGLLMKLNDIRVLKTNLDAFFILKCVEHGTEVIKETEWGLNLDDASFRCEKILQLYNETPELFEGFTMTVMAEFINAMDSLTNADNILSVNAAKKSVAEIIQRMNGRDLVKALDSMPDRLSGYVNLVNDAHSSYSNLNESITSEVVVALGDIQKAIANPPIVKESAVKAPIQKTVLIEPERRDEPCDGETKLKKILKALKPLETRKARLDFFKRSISDINMNGTASNGRISEINEMATEAFDIALYADNETVDLLIQLFFN